MIMVAVSKMGVAGLFFVKPGVIISGKYYRDVLQSQQLLPAIRHVVADNYFVFQQDTASAHRARETIELLQHLISFLQSYGPPTYRT